MTDRPENIDQLTERLVALERRVYVLEHTTAAPPPLTLPTRVQPAPLQAAVVHPMVQASSAFSVLGKAMLGIAGAYLLRAVAESSLLPRPVAAAVAIAYAILWLVVAARMAAGAWFASLTYACTAGLILAPMLWELTLRFEVLTAAVAAGSLAVFVGVAFALAWKREGRAVLWVASITAVAVAVSLSITSHQMAPFIALLLFMAAFSEFSVACGNASGTRIIVALGADVVLWVQIYIYSGPRGAHPDYPPAGMAALLLPSFTLFLLFAVSVVRKTIAKQETISVFESIQAMAAFLLAACAWLYFGPASSAFVLGILCLAFSAACYVAVYRLFERNPERRNATVFGWWSVALLLAASLLCLPAGWQAAWLSVVAIAAVLLGERLPRPALVWHGFAYVCAAAIMSGLPAFLYGALVGSVPGNPAPGLYVAAVSAAFCAALQRPRPDERWMLQIQHLAFEILAVGALAALLAQGLAALVALRLIPAAYHLALIRTLTLCMAAFGLAFGGARMERREMTRMSYAILVLVAAKLIFEDLRNGRLEYTAASIFLFAVTLIAVSRSTRQGQQA